MGKKTSKKTKTKKSGTGKFFLGALLGAAAGAVANHFTEDKAKNCSCEKAIAKKPTAKKATTAKKTTTKKSATKKSK